MDIVKSCLECSLLYSLQISTRTEQKICCSMVFEVCVKYFPGVIMSSRIIAYVVDITFRVGKTRKKGRGRGVWK